MISITGDEHILKYARFLENIQVGEGAKFLYAYYDKKYGDSLLIKKFPFVYSNKTFNLRYEEFSVFIKLEDLLERINPIFEKFFQCLPKGSRNKILKEAVDIREAEKDVLSIIMMINKDFKANDISAIYKSLYSYFPKGKESVFENKVLALEAHYELHGGCFRSGGLKDLFSLIVDVDYNSTRAEKHLVL